MKRALFLSAGLILLAATPAQAGWRRERAQAIAQIVWNHPCADRVTLEWAYMDPLVYAAGAWPERCLVQFNTARPKNWEVFCTNMLHEYGHLAGMEHSTNPRSVMYVPPAGVVFSFVPDPRCAHRGRPYLERHGILKPRHCARRRLRCADGPGSQPESRFR